MADHPRGAGTSAWRPTRSTRSVSAGAGRATGREDQGDEDTANSPPGRVARRSGGPAETWTDHRRSRNQPSHRSGAVPNGGITVDVTLGHKTTSLISSSPSGVPRLPDGPTGISAPSASASARWRLPSDGGAAAVPAPVRARLPRSAGSPRRRCGPCGQTW